MVANPSTRAVHVHVAVAVNVHDHDHVNADDDAASTWSPTYDPVY